MDFTAFSLASNLGWFVAGSAAIWVAGTLLSSYADEIARRTGLGHVLVGLFLLAGVTSLPEIATSFTAAAQGESQLAVSNLLGSIALQVAVLAMGDMVYSRGALTYLVPDPALMLQGTLNVILLLLVALAIVAGDRALGGAGLWTWGLLVAVVYSFVKLHEAGDREPWIANVEPPSPEEETSREEEPFSGSLAALLAKTALCGATILAAGFVVAQAAAAIARQTGTSASFMGMAFLAISTSLPEVSTVFAAMRQRLFAMAIADIFGTNLLNVARVFGIDLVAGGPPVLNQVGRVATAGALLGALVTALFMMGLAERRDRTFLRMGIDSVFVLVAYGAGMVLLYRLAG